MWVLPIIGLVLGIVLGVWLPLEIPAVYSHYFAVVLFAALEGVLTGLLEGMQDSFDMLSFWSGILVTVVVAFLLVFMGEYLGVDLYLAVLFALGYRILQTAGDIHSLLMHKFKSNSMEKREK